MKEDMKKQHENNYKKVLLEVIMNNTKALIEDDILSLIRKPPLDSMDFIQSKFLDSAKKNHMVLDTNALNELLHSYRLNLEKFCNVIQKERIRVLTSCIENYPFQKSRVFTLYKKDFSNLNKEIRKIIKEQLKTSYEKTIQKNLFKVFPYEKSSLTQDKFVSDISRFFEKTFEKQFLENCDIKILVKDTTLMNLVKEQGERYLFTLKNSRVFQTDSNDIDS